MEDIHAKEGPVLGELSAYVRNCGVKKCAPATVLRQMLASSVTMALHRDVYTMVGGDMGKHEYLVTKKGGSADDYQRHAFSQHFWRELYAGASLTVRKDRPTPVFDAFCSSVIDPITHAKFTRSQKLMLFQMLNGDRIHSTMIHGEYNDLGLVLTPSQRKYLGRGMGDFQVKEDHEGSLVREISSIIQNTVFPSIKGIQWESLTDSEVQRYGTPTFPGTDNGAPAPHVEEGNTDSLRFRDHRKWTRQDELTWGNAEFLRAYKTERGLPVFAENHQTLMDFIQDSMSESERDPPKAFTDMDDSTFAGVLDAVMNVTDPKPIMETKQAKTFYQAMVNSVSNYQLGKWDSHDIMERMVMSHHPQWEKQWNKRWNPDKTMLVQIRSYLKQWPSIGPELMEVLRTATASEE